MQRILIIGIPGSGKSTLAIKLGKILGLPVIHLDKHFWQSGWVMTRREIWRPKVAEMVAEDSWIIDGTYDNSLDIRLPRADAVIFLDFATSTCIWRIFKRVLSTYGKSRPDMAPGCLERFDFDFVKYVWKFRRAIRPIIVDSIDKMFRGNKLITLKSRREIGLFLERTAASRELT